MRFWKRKEPEKNERGIVFVKRTNIDLIGLLRSRPGQIIEYSGDLPLIKGNPKLNLRYNWQLDLWVAHKRHQSMRDICRKIGAEALTDLPYIGPTEPAAPTPSASLD